MRDGAEREDKDIDCQARGHASIMMGLLRFCLHTTRLHSWSFKVLQKVHLIQPILYKYHVT